MAETLSTIIWSINERNALNQIVVNAGKLVDMQSNRALYESVRDADMVNADGMAVVWASKFLGDPLPERVAGIDLMIRLVELSAKEGFKIFFFGAKEQVVSKVVDRYKAEYGENIVAGYRNGYYNKDEEENIAKEIAASNADILFVAITSPKKEIFLNRYKHILNIPFTMGVGGSFDVVAGETKRAPVWMQNLGLEWFYRFIQEPKRMWKRYLIGNTIFVYLIIKQKLGFYKNPFD
ncbi:MAG: exopolysaccharide biosynthesis glycosyltransferase VpsK [Ekhidna sp.]